MVDKVKSYNIDGVAANVQFGSQGPSFIGSDSSKIRLEDNTGNLAEAKIGNATIGSHAVTLQQLKTQSQSKLRNDQFVVAFNGGNVNLANAQPNTWITSVVVEASNVWTSADSNTEITVGDSGNSSRLFSGFDVDAQSIDETDYKYTSETTITAFVTQGAASAGNAIVTIWYVGELNDPPAGGGGGGDGPAVTSGLVLQLDAGNISSYPGSGTTWSDVGGAYSGVLTNGAAYSSDNGGVIRLDGTNDYVNIDDDPSLRAPIGIAITIQMWAKISSATANDGLFSKQFGAASYDGFSLVTGNNNKLQLNMNGAVVNGIYASGSNNVWTTNTWYLFTAIVHFGGNSKVYVNTSKVIDVNNAESSMPSPNAPLRIGQGIQDSAGHPAMDVGQFYFYNKALTEQEITDNYNATKSRYGL